VSARLAPHQVQRVGGECRQTSPWKVLLSGIRGASSPASSATSLSSGQPAEQEAGGRRPRPPRGWFLRVITQTVRAERDRGRLVFATVRRAGRRPRPAGVRCAEHSYDQAGDPAVHKKLSAVSATGHAIEPDPRRCGTGTPACSGMTAQVPAAHPAPPCLGLRGRRGAQVRPWRATHPWSRAGRAGTSPRGPDACNVRKLPRQELILARPRTGKRAGCINRHGVRLASGHHGAGAGTIALGELNHALHRHITLSRLPPPVELAAHSLNVAISAKTVQEQCRPHLTLPAPPGQTLLFCDIREADAG